jgi:hypothetical protein
MSSKKPNQKFFQQVNNQGQKQKEAPNHKPIIHTVPSLLDIMVDEKEYSSILDVGLNPGTDLIAEIKRAILDIEKIRGNKMICYLANMTNLAVQQAPISIDASDDLPFYELLDSIDHSEDKLDIMLVTPGGSVEKIDHYVNLIRSRFTEVNFIIPYMAMSAGTIFSMSGDSIIMDKNACIGPIDPQVVSKEGRFVPAQSILTLLEEIKSKGEDAISKGKSPAWTDVQILKNLDAKEVGRAINASNLSIELVKEYSIKYKFKSWTTHSSTENVVSEEEKIARAEEIAKILCDHSLWKSHSRAISRDLAIEKCKLQITYPEDTPQLERAIRRFWALLSWVFEKTPIYKIYISDNSQFIKSINITQQHK